MQLYTLPQVAEKLGITERHVRTLVLRGYLACIDVAPTPHSHRPVKRVREDDLFAFIESRRIAATPRLSMRERRRAAALRLQGGL